MIITLFRTMGRALPAGLRDVFPLDSKIKTRLGIILGVLFLSAVVVPRAVSNNRGALSLLILVPAAIGFLVLLRWPDIGFFLIIISGLVVPISIGTGTQSSINPPIVLVVLLTGLWIFKLIAIRGSTVEISRPFWPAIAIIVSVFVSFGFGQFHWFPIPPASLSAQLGGLMIFVLSASAFLVTAYHLQSLASLKWLVWTFLALCGIFLVSTLTPVIGPRIVNLYRLASVDSMFWMWFGVLGYCQAAFNTRLKPGWRIVIGLAVAAAIYNTFFVYRDWSSGWVPMLVAIGVCTFIARPRYSIFLALLLIPLTVIYYQRAVGMVMTGDNTYSLMTRMEAWQITFRIIKVNPIFGLGPANYYWYTALFPILGYFVQFNSHNNYIDIISQTGLVGLAAFLWFCWENGRLIWRSVSRVPDGFERSFLYGCFGGLVGAMVSAMLGDWVLPFVYNIGLRGFRTSVLTFLFLGGAVAIGRMLISAPQNVENS